MKTALLIFLGAISLLRADALPVALKPSARVEEHFQLARKLYLSGDRDGALSELNQALSLNPYHSGSTTLYKTIHDEEKDLRQVRLRPLSSTTAPKLSVRSSPNAGNEALLRNLQRELSTLEGKTTQRFSDLERRAAHVDSEMNVLQAEISGHDEGVSQLKDNVKRMEGRQDSLFFGLLALLVILVLLLAMTVRMLMKIQRRD
jgi:hypothetical protein